MAHFLPRANQAVHFGVSAQWELLDPWITIRYDYQGGGWWLTGSSMPVLVCTKALDDVSTVERAS